MNAVAEHAAEIRAALARYLTSAAGDPDVRRLADLYQLLPIMHDWTAFVGLSPEGQLMWVNYEAPHGPESIDQAEGGLSSARLRHVALAQGAKEFPELAFLRPHRDSSSVDCSHCGGTGVVLLAGKPAPPGFVWACGGLGWLPAEAVQP
jgi:hypothetical protein